MNPDGEDQQDHQRGGGAHALIQLRRGEAGRKEMHDGERDEIRGPAEEKHQKVTVGPGKNVAGGFLHQDAAHRAGSRADAHDAGHSRPREHIRRSREEIAGPALVRGGSEADQADRDPRYA